MPRTATAKALTSRQPKPVAKRKLHASDLFELLRTDILQCRLKPGARLLFKDLARTYGSGISQLREALMRLVADGLVDLENHKGFRVAPVSREELSDILSMRCELETLAIRLAIEKGDLRWEANIMARFHEVSNQPIFDVTGRLSDEWDHANDAFHQALYAACGSKILVEMCNQLRARYGRYRRLWAHYGNPTAETVKDHENLMRAVIARNASTALPLLRKHFNRTTTSILENWSAVETESA